LLGWLPSVGAITGGPLVVRLAVGVGDWLGLGGGVVAAGGGGGAAVVGGGGGAAVVGGGATGAAVVGTGTGIDET
jgi:hypothetical protein